jgi:hypothetical protein
MKFHGIDWGVITRRPRRKTIGDEHHWSQRKAAASRRKNFTAPP